MNIQPISNSVSMRGSYPQKPGGNSKWLSRCKQKVLDIFSDANFKDNKEHIKKLNKRTTDITNPAINRAIMGVTALALQPPIDYSNKAVDKDTRRISVCRTVAKILAGTLVGIIVRGSAHKIISKMTNVESKNTLKKALIPKSFMEKFTKEPTLLSNYRSALSTGTAILAMCITNFAIDAPLTVYLTNKFKDWTDKQKQTEKEQKTEKMEVSYA